MNEVKYAIITGASGAMGTEITRAVAQAGYYVIMACYNSQKAETVRQSLVKETGNPNLEVMTVDLASMQSITSFADRILERKLSISLLMNNAEIMETGFYTTTEGFERTVSVNYAGPYLLTRRLIPAMLRGARIVNMISCTYPFGRIDLPDFLHRGKIGKFRRIPVYINTKLALLLFTFELSQYLQGKGITVNAADPGIVSTKILKNHKWFDLLTDIFFRPLIRTPKKGAETAIRLLLNEEESGVTGKLYANNCQKQLSDKYINHVQKEQLWEVTERSLAQWFT